MYLNNITFFTDLFNNFSGKNDDRNIDIDIDCGAETENGEGGADFNTNI